jgi:predicted GNAT superfamily acetyltransferase
MVGSADYKIRRAAEGMDDFFAIAHLQRRIWGDNSLVITSPHLVKVQVELGALVLVAYRPDDEIIGFVYSFPGTRKGESMHWSHMLGVLSEYRGAGIGKALKWRQCDELLEEGFSVCCWTFDPLQAINGRLNIVNLGARTDEYIVNAYSSRDEYLDEGMPTDRLVARWELDCETARAARTGKSNRCSITMKDLPMAITPEKVDDGYVPSKFEFHGAKEYVGVPIPGDITRMRRDVTVHALQWRLAVREALQYYFNKGYMLTDTLNPEESKSPTHVYVLQKLK